MLRRTHASGDDAGASPLLIDVQKTAKIARKPHSRSLSHPLARTSANASVPWNSTLLIDARAAEVIDAKQL